MRSPLIVSALAALSAQGARVLQSNDDGWAELYVRSFNDALNAAGHDVVLSAPAENKSGSGSSDAEPTDRTSACQYDSCPARSGPIGTNVTNTRLNWVNSFPVTSVKYGLSTFGPQFWNGQAPDIVVTGPNVGGNLWLAVPFSGTVGAAAYAAHDAGIPAIAFSGASDGTLAFNTRPVPARSTVYAQLATTLTNALLKSGAPYLPDDVYLNVNFPKVEGACTDASKFKWVLSRINPGLFSSPDLNQCGGTRLPTETDVINAGGCRISVSPGDASDKSTVNDVAKQTAVRDKLASLLTCL